MKNLILYSGIVVLFLTSCEYHYEELRPVASFSVNYDLVIPNEVISFYNNSYDARDYEWDFGDGYSSTDINPTYSYSQEGTYTVTLAAYNGSNVDYAYYQIEVYETTMEVQVVEWETRDVIPRANVTLYTSFYDWENFNNPVISATTDSYGIVVFTGLNAISYYIDAYNTSFTNEYIGYEDDVYIKTLPLVHGGYNTFTAYVDYIPASIKSAVEGSDVKRTRKMVIKEIKRSVKDVESLQGVKERE